jgi:hypothetical protein
MCIATKKLPDPDLGVVDDDRAGYIFSSSPVINVFTR